MEIRHLRYFVAVANERHFGRAAEKVGIGQPPLSQQIQALERELGTTLFRRIPRKLELTHAGEVLLDDARWILARADQAVRNVERASRGEIGRLSVGLTVTSSYIQLVPAAIRTFREAFPDVVLDLSEAASNTLCSGLLSGDVDVAFIRPPSPDDEKIHLETLLDEEVLVALPRGHRLEKSRRVPLASLAEETFVLYPREIALGLVDRIIAACGKAGFTPHIVQEAPQIPAAVNLVAAGIGISLVPASVQCLHPEGVTYLPLQDNGLVAALSLAYRRGETVATVRNFVRLIRAESKKNSSNGRKR